jgi:branched-chain amino acid transport system permease protein
MIHVMKKTYGDYTKIFDRRIKWYWVMALIVFLLFLPLWGGDYFLSLLVNACIFAIVGLSLVLLMGLCGQISLGHAAFFAVGAYSSCIFVSTWGVPFFVAMMLAGVICLLVGLLVGLPSLRMKDLYLGIATMALAFIVEDILTKWESVTGGTFGISVPRASVGGFVFDSEISYYYLVFVFLIFFVVVSKNIHRSGYGRALMAINGSEVAAQAMGINIYRYKLVIFALSAFYTGIAGSLFGHYAGYILPDTFNFLVTINFLIMIIVGGTVSVVGAILGGLYMSLIPGGTKILIGLLPSYFAKFVGLDIIFYALILLVFISYQPEGLHGLWIKVKTYYDDFPLYKKGTFRKERKFYRKKIL